MQKVIVPEQILPQEEIESCSDCRFFEMRSGWDGEYFCTKTRKDINYGDAIEEIDVDCPLDEVENES